MSGFTVWRKRHGGWERVAIGLTNSVAQGDARLRNAVAKSERTGWLYCVTPDGGVPDVKRGLR